MLSIKDGFEEQFTNTFHLQHTHHACIHYTDRQARLIKFKKETTGTANITA